MLVLFTDTVIFLIKTKIQKDGVEKIMLFLVLCNVGMAFLYVVTPIVYLLSTWTWTALTKRRDQPALTPIGRLESRAAEPEPATPSVQTPEAPPPPYHIAVNSTPPPSYFSIFPKQPNAFFLTQHTTATFFPSTFLHFIIFL